jgi:PST family polysaccharide transporter
MSHPLFDTPSEGFKSRAIRGAALTAISQGIKLAVSFLSVIILARMLKPSDFGIFAMVTPLIGLSQLFQDFGLTQALITSKNVDQSSATGMFKINFLLSVVVALILMALSPVVAYFYQQPAVIPITCSLAVAVIFSGAGATHFALLTRGLRFNALTTIETIRALGSFAAAIAVAALYPGPFALVVQFGASAAIGLIMAWTMTRWRPSGPIVFHKLRPMLHFGAGMTTFNLTNYLSRNADNVMIGWARGAAELGLYDRAYKLLLFPLGQINQPVSSVMTPILARLVDEPERYRSAYLRTLSITMLVTVPGVLSMMLTADILIPTLMGGRWTAAVPIFQWLAIAGLHQTVSNTFGWLFVTQRRTTEYARFGVVSTITCLVAFAAGLPWGAKGVAAGYALSGLFIRLPLIVWIVGKRGPVTYYDIIRLAAPYFLAAGGATAIWVGVRPMINLPSVISLLVQVSLVFMATWAILLLTPIGRASLNNVLDLLSRRKQAA